jgi:hydroxyacylglutathione hydrolase
MTAKLTTVVDGVQVGPLFPRNVFNTVLIQGPDGDVVVDAGLPWSSRRLARYLEGRDVTEHVVTHAHGDHVGSTAWLCSHTGAPLAMSEIEADDFENGSIAYHAGVLGRRLVAPMGHKRRPVDRRLKEGDVVAGFEVLAQPGHSPGLLALWRAADRTLIVGDGPVNISSDPKKPRWLPLPKGLHHDPRAAVASRWRMTELEPDLIVSTHGYPVQGQRWVEGLRAAAH